MSKPLKYFLFTVLGIILVFFAYLFLGKAPEAEEITWGVNFSQKHAQDLGLDWKEIYLALLDDLGVDDLKVAAHWDLIEPENNKYDFNDIDWQISEAEKRGVKILLAIGMKTPRWPECHLPSWAWGLSEDEQQKEILEMLEVLVLRYKNSPAIYAWQVENEPFFPFGVCPWVDKDFVEKEVNLVRSLDEFHHPIVISSSGEGSFWILSGQLGDIAGTTMYKKTWVQYLHFYFTYQFPPVFYYRKAEIIKTFFNKPVICVELQAEPWCPTLLYDCSVQEQKKTMNLEQFKYNIEFAKQTGLDTFYLWGGEWWYWMKTKQGDASFWEEAKKLWQ